MSHLRTKGIVIKEVRVGEADKIITIFTKSYGKISAVAKGAKRPKSRLICCIAVFMLQRFYFI